MARCATQPAWRASVATWRSSSICPRTWPNAPACLSVPSSTTILTQRRSLFVLPLGLDVGIAGAAAYMFLRLRPPSPDSVKRIFGPDPWSKEGQQQPEALVQCIAHRGAGLDAPENTLEAFKYCVENQCRFVEFDVRMSRDGQLVLLHDKGLARLADCDLSDMSDVSAMDWDMIKDIDVGATHPNRSQFKEVRLCRLDAALDYLLENNVRMIIDVKGDHMEIVTAIVDTFARRPELHKHAAVTCFNPYILYQIRRRDPDIVGCLSYRPACFSAQDYDAESGPTNPRFPDNRPLHWLALLADAAHAALWRVAASGCGVGAVLLHKDIVNSAEIAYWRARSVRVVGWSVNRPLEKLYWRGVMRAPYLANTLVREPAPLEQDDTDIEMKSYQCAEELKTIIPKQARRLSY
ncbi:glycerophosphodiester phosphodiesterase 1 isoform X1 [Plutella xylostella]|uniref:glycerophosphodiester phosphodiesterase 1 isoform X1 n=1 Tax=Plutella xylostella TaxID=51655 RepID=UPI002032C373|nr:glycerophosphodiester phosphodiesterase 1 isoform X1 [Plutella xylostella]XP_048485952.1 glycerophosphodiester phosphodiesterase 1 isoform X1 [Plutella xylostella]